MHIVMVVGEITCKAAVSAVCECECVSVCVRVCVCVIKVRPVYCSGLF